MLEDSLLVAISYYLTVQGPKPLYAVETMKTILESGAWPTIFVVDFRLYRPKRVGVGAPVE